MIEEKTSGVIFTLSTKTFALILRSELNVCIDVKTFCCPVVTNCSKSEL